MEQEWDRKFKNLGLLDSPDKIMAFLYSCHNFFWIRSCFETLPWSNLLSIYSMACEMPINRGVAFWLEPNEPLFCSPLLLAVQLKYALFEKDTRKACYHQWGVLIRDWPLDSEKHLYLKPCQRHQEFPSSLPCMYCPPDNLLDPMLLCSSVPMGAVVSNMAWLMTTKRAFGNVSISQILKIVQARLGVNLRSFVLFLSKAVP